MVSEVNSEVNIGHLVDFDWKVGMACTSNHCKNLDAPIVTVKFHLKDDSNQAYSKTIEMTLAEFQVRSILTIYTLLKKSLCLYTRHHI